MNTAAKYTILLSICNLLNCEEVFIENRSNEFDLHEDGDVRDFCAKSNNDFACRSTEAHEATSEASETDYNFAVLLNPLLTCAERRGVTVYVLSQPTDFDVRASIRETWARNAGSTLAIVFVLGRSDDADTNRKLEEESAAWSDLLQFDAPESYRDLARKHVAALKYFSQHCPPLALLAKVDTDVYVNTRRLLQVVATAHLQEWRGFHCRVFSNTRPIRSGSGTKWEVSKEEYAADTYPSYCLGSAHLLTADDARRIHEAALRTRFFWIDDVFVSGVLREAAGIAISNMKTRAGFENFYTSIDYKDVNIRSDNVFVELRRSVTQTLWRKLHEAFTLWDEDADELRSAYWTEE